MKASSINLTGGTWELFNVNLIIKDGHLKNYKLAFSNDLKHRNNETTNGFNLTFVNTFYSYPEIIGSNPLIQIINSNALFANTTIRNVHGSSYVPVIVANLNSKLKFSNCKVSEIVEEGIFVLTFNFTTIYIENCIIKNNTVGSLFQSQGDCHTVVEGSAFAESRLPDTYLGSVFAVSNNSKIDIFNSTFHTNEVQFLWGEFYMRANISYSKYVGNTIKNMAAVKLFYHCYLSVENCDFFNNAAESLPVSIVVDYNVTLTVRDSSFFNNTGGTSSSLAVSRSSAYIHNVRFGSNSAVQGSGISLFGQAKVYVKQSTFYGDIVGPSVYASPGGDLIFENCLFVNHSSSADSLIEIHSSKLRMINCIINNNKMGINGGIVQATTSIITIQKCQFHYNSGRYGSLFFLSRMSRITIEGSVLQDNTGSIGGCLYVTDSDLQVIDTIFINNKAVIQGGAIAGERYNITIQNSNFTNHSAASGGVIFMLNGTKMANNSVFENNTSPGGSGAVVMKSYNGDLVFDNCLLNMNVAPWGTIWNYYDDNSIMRLSNTNCTLCKNCYSCLCFVVKDGYNLTVYTSKFNIDYEKIHISSSDSNFITEALKNKLITTDGDKIHWKELPFASGKTTISNTLI